MRVNETVTKVKYNRLPITRTFKGNQRKFELSGARGK